jgi:hypothetical protein
MTKKFDAITDAFERGRMAERARLKETVREALTVISELLYAIDGSTDKKEATGASMLNKVREPNPHAAPPLYPKKDDHWRKQ